MSEYEKIKKMYENGFRCIRYDDTKDGDLNMYFKNFEDELSDTIKVKNFDEKMKIKSFIKENPMS